MEVEATGGGVGVLRDATGRWEVWGKRTAFAARRPVLNTKTRSAPDKECRVKQILQFLGILALNGGVGVLRLRRRHDV